jgi:hypothetical protein
MRVGDETTKKGKTGWGITAWGVPPSLYRYIGIIDLREFPPKVLIVNNLKIKY